jgi:hypothetical protein
MSGYREANARGVTGRSKPRLTLEHPAASFFVVVILSRRNHPFIFQFKKSAGLAPLPCSLWQIPAHHFPRMRMRGLAKPAS